jgi:cell wall-associated NlpC family hydrolase
VFRKSAVLAALALAAILPSSPAHAATSTAPPAKLVAASAFVAIQSTAPTSYVVQRGDTLSGIAAEFCGRASAYRSIGDASGIARYNLIYPGQRITLTCTAPKLAAVRKPVPAKAKTPTKPTAVVASTRGIGTSSSAVAFAMGQIGKPYVWGATGPNSFDCSGLVVAAYARVGIRLPHQSSAIAGYGRPVSGPLQPGDLLFLSSGGHVYHVIVYVGGGQIVEAASPGQGVVRHGIYPYSFARRLV